MEPRVQYAQTKDGVSIAFWTYGDGPPLLQMPSAAISPSLQAWRTPQGQRWYEGLAGGRMLIRYDNRGCGNSQREPIDYSIEAQLMDLDAVIDALGLERLDLLGYLGSGPIAIAYAGGHPERVRRLVLWCSPVRGTDMATAKRGALNSLRDTDWEFFTETIALAWFGWSAAEQARHYASALRESVSAEAMRELMEANNRLDVSDLLAKVQAPTLVLHRRDLRLPPLDAARHLAAHIPGARLAILEGDAGIPYVGDIEPVLAELNAFLGEQPPARDDQPSGMVTVLFTDIEASTAMTQRLGDASAQELIRAHDEIVREALVAHHGAEIKHTGDGIMASFPTASRALDCAAAIQRAVAERANESDQSALHVRIGLNAGEPVVQGQDLFGTAVQLARRICDHAEGGQILASNVVRELAAGKGFLFADIGEVLPKGFEEPVRLYEARWARREL